KTHHFSFRPVGMECFLSKKTFAARFTLTRHQKLSCFCHFCTKQARKINQVCFGRSLVKSNADRICIQNTDKASGFFCLSRQSCRFAWHFGSNSVKQALTSNLNASIF